MSVDLGKKVLIDHALFLTKDVLPNLAYDLAIKATSNAIVSFERKISEREAARAVKRLTLFHSNKHKGDVIRF